MESAACFVRAAEEGALVVYSAYGMMLVGAAVLVTLLGFISAPYGRYAETSSNSFLSGLKLPARACWVLMESPALIVTVLFHRYGLITTGGRVTIILYSYFLVHYFHRSLIFPFRMKAGAPMPLFIMLSALFYCTWNALMQAVFFLRVARYEDDWVYDPRFLLGSALFLFGMAANIQSDNILMNLRKPGETGYKIPRGGMFEYVSSANYGCEIIEWCGFAIASWSLPGLAFAIFTFCNTGPRGFKHHQWYLQKFEDYPKNRKAVIPFLW